MKLLQKKWVKVVLITMSVLSVMVSTAFVLFFGLIFYLFGPIGCDHLLTSKNFPNDNYGTLYVYGSSCGFGANAEEDQHGYFWYTLKEKIPFIEDSELGTGYGAHEGFDGPSYSKEIHFLDEDYYFRNGKYLPPLPYVYLADKNELVMKSN